MNGSIEVDSYPESRVHNSQPHGIGRVVTIGGSWAWNNLGRNVVFAGDDLVPRALYDESAFADDEPSQYDLDVHAILAVPDDRLGSVIHLAAVRDLERIRDAFNELVAPFERAREVHLVHSIPRSPLGKLLRANLAELIAS